ncbi:multiple inositol polyphosphate phosphatase 1-like [Xylocopa sonorina]|uniref:multiple inositol polyphosphate phosphatase 1-like n=1 Tax=Xylocopa sonorina TaxID=1818115 RepID=UPI00403AD3F5
MFDTKVTVVLITLCFTRSALSDAEANYCYADDKNPYLLHSTTTAYEVEHGLIANTTLPNCKPIQIWMLARHGTRYPTKDEIHSMKHNLPEIQRSILENSEAGNGSLCQKDLEKLKSWKLDSNVNKNNRKFLTKQGEEDLLQLGRRFKHYFPDLLQSYPPDVLEDKYKFRSTDTQRTIASMKNFISGLFGNITVNNTVVVPTAEDVLLKLYKICKPWLDQGNNSEADKFASSPIYGQVLADISQRLGFSRSLSHDDVRVMHIACAYESAWNIKERSPWCAAFMKDQLKVFEYERDLHYYYYASYGRNLSNIIGCPLVQDMFKHFTEVERGESSAEPQGIFYFSHSSALQLFFTAMGIAKDSAPLKASNFESMRDRKWDTSHIVPFATNIAAIFYKCDSSSKVRFYLNEKPLDFEGCEDGVCDWEYLKKRLEPSLLNCNIDFCFK